jgi:hypothetical protein
LYYGLHVYEMSGEVMKVLSLKALILFGILFCILLGGVGQWAFGTQKRVAIIPFTMNADRDLSFLQKGIMDMLASRLAWKGEVDIVPAEQVKEAAAAEDGPLTQEKALALGRHLGASHVILGSLTVIGESVSMDARILDVANSEELVTAFKQTKGMDEVIPSVNQFAMDINEKLMGRVVPKEEPPVIEETMEKGVAPVAGPMVPGGLALAGQAYSGEGLMQIQRIAIEILGMEGGDIDGDGKAEVVMISRQKVHVYKWKNKGLALFKEYSGGMSSEHLFVSVGDLNNNGRAEIYVNNLSMSGVDSYVLEWNGGDLQKIIKGEAYFLRVFNYPGKGPTLIGQRRSPNYSFHGQVFILGIEGKKLVSQGPLQVPSITGPVWYTFLNAWNFSLSTFGDKAGYHIVVQDSHENLRLYGPDGKIEWKSEKFYGGALAYIEIRNDPGAPLVHMPSPSYITDVDKDGTPEVMICQNQAFPDRWLARARTYKSGLIHFLKWDPTGLSVQYTTKKFAGPITGYQILDLNGDGREELVLVTVLKTRHVASKGRSQFVVYDLK